MRAHHGWHAQRPRHDGHVRGRPAEIGCVPEDIAAAEEHDVGGRQVFGDHDGLGLDSGDQLAAPQVTDDAILDVEQVVGTLPDVLAAASLHALPAFAQGRLDDVAGVQALVADAGSDRLLEGLILQHERLGRKDSGAGFPQLLAGNGDNLCQLAVGAGNRGVKTFDFALYLRLVDHTAPHIQVLAGIQVGRSNGDAL